MARQARARKRAEPPFRRAPGSKSRLLQHGADHWPLYGLVALARGSQVVIFPEGTRTAPDQRVDYHPGIAAVYRDAGVPIVPVALDSGLYWPRRSLLRRPGRIQVEICPPIPAELPRREFMRRLESEIEGASERLLRQARSGGYSGDGQ